MVSCSVTQLEQWQVSFGDPEPHALNLVVLEQTESVYKDPREGTPEIYNFVHYKRHDSSCKNVILHPGIPCCP